MPAEVRERRNLTQKPCAGQMRTLRQRGCLCMWQLGKQGIPGAKGAVSQDLNLFRRPSRPPPCAHGQAQVSRRERWGGERTGRGRKSAGLVLEWFSATETPAPQHPCPSPGKEDHPSPWETAHQWGWRAPGGQVGSQELTKFKT